MESPMIQQELENDDGGHCSGPAESNTESLPKDNFPEVLEDLEASRKELDLDLALLDEETLPTILPLTTQQNDRPQSISVGHVEEGFGEFPPSQGGTSSQTHSHHSKEVQKKLSGHDNPADKGGLASTMLSVRAPAHPSSSRATAWAPCDQTQLDEIKIKHLKETVKTFKRQMEASLEVSGGRDNTIPFHVEKLKRCLTELHMDTSQLDAFFERWSLLIDRYNKFVQSPEDADAVKEQVRYCDQLQDKEAHARAVLTESFKTMDADRSKAVTLSKSIQDLIEEESRLEEELASVRKKKTTEMMDLAAAQDVLQGLIHQAAVDDYDLIK